MVTVTVRGKKHTFVGMYFYFTDNGEVRIYIKDYINIIISGSMRLSIKGARHLQKVIF